MYGHCEQLMSVTAHLIMQVTWNVEFTFEPPMSTRFTAHGLVFKSSFEICPLVTRSMRPSSIGLMIPLVLRHVDRIYRTREVLHIDFFQEN